MSFRLSANGICRGSEPLATGAGTARAVSGSCADGLVGTATACSCADALPAGVPLLFIDASAPQVQTGLWQDGCWLAHRCSDAPALEEIFRSVSELLRVAGLPFAAIGGFIHNEGPGSILGIRLGAMALRVWVEGAQAKAAGTASPLPVWAVRSLPLVAAKVVLCAEKAGTEAQRPAAGIGVFSEFRQGLWNWFTLCADDAFGEGIDVIETDELAQRIEALQPDGICRHLRHRKSWESPPVVVPEADANLRDCPEIFYTPGLLRCVSAPEALLTRAPEFKRASGERHRGTDPQAPATGGGQG